MSISMNRAMITDEAAVGAIVSNLAIGLAVGTHVPVMAKLALVVADASRAATVTAGVVLRATLPILPGLAGIETVGAAPTLLTVRAHVVGNTESLVAAVGA